MIGNRLHRACGVIRAGELPSQVTLTVAEAAPHMRGESASAQQKRAVMDNGAQVRTSTIISDPLKPVEVFRD